MTQKVDQMLDRFGALNRLFDTTSRRLTESWKPDVVPPVIAMAALARTYCEASPQLSSGEKSAIFDEVERVLSQGDEETKDVVATAFLETLQGLAASGKCDFREIGPLLGPRSKGYCKAWDHFCGATTPGL